jgi:RimJ/RimL family protein N-acetyltransferase
MSVSIKTRRLCLRRPKLSDAKWITDGLNNFAVAGNMLVPFPFEMDHALDWLNQTTSLKAPGEARFCIEHENDGGVGVIGFRLIKTRPRMGYWLDERFWGRGIMSEAVKTTLGWYYATTKVDIVTSGVFHFNVASLAIQRKVGFVETGRSMVRCLARNADIEHIDTKLTRQAFEAAVK